ncbi:unnamed protein product, partial [marine sediment metagenome]
DVDFLGLYKLLRLAAPASGGALRKGMAEIVNADIAVGADIVYSKLYLTGKIKAADIVTAAGIPYSKLNLALKLLVSDIKADQLNAANKLLQLDASALVALAQIPDTLTGKSADKVDGYDASDLWTPV